MAAQGKASAVKPPRHPKLSKRSSSEGDEPTKAKEESARRLLHRRNHTTSCSSYFNNKEAVRKFLNDPRVVAENAKHLSPEQMEEIYFDILKPSDFFEIFFNRLKARDNEQPKAQLNEN